MKRLLTKLAVHSSSIFVILMVVFGTFQPLIAQADNPSTGPYYAPGTNTQAASTPSQVTSTPQAGGGIDNSSGIGCNISTALGNFGGTFALCLTNVVYIFTVGIGSGFAYVSAYFFDFAINLSLSSAAYGLNFVSQGWTTARDLANMAFLFILIYIAFMIMFEAESSGTVQMLAAVVVVALLVNFSFFLTRLAIDGGNILSIQFYNAITAPSIASSAQNAGVAAASVVTTVNNTVGANSLSSSKDLTASIMGMLQLQNLFSTQSFNAFFNGSGANAGSSTGAGFMVTVIALSFLYIAAAIMFWLLTIMFATAGVKFLFRIVALWFLIIASPLAFVAHAIPGMEKYFKQWFSMLIENAFYPAAFMFIFLILTNFSTQMSCPSGTTSTSCNGLINGIFDGLSSATNSSSAVAQIGYAAANVGIRMGFIIAMLWVGLEASKRLGVMGGEQANKFGTWAGSKMVGTIGGAGRYSFGWTGNRLAQSDAIQTRAASNPIARGLWRGLNKVGGASFDARGGLGALGIDAGKAGGKGGYKAAFDARVKRREEEAKKFKEYKEPSKEEKEKQATATKADAERRAAVEYDTQNPGSRQSLEGNLAKAAENQQKAATAEELASRELKEAAQHIDDLSKQGIQGSEMETAIANRKGKEANLTHFAAIKSSADDFLKNLQKEREEQKKVISTRATLINTQLTAVNQEAEEAKNLRKVYGKAIGTRVGNWSRLGIYVPMADKAASDKIRKGKSKEEKIADAVKEAGKDDSEAKESESKKEASDKH